MPPISAFIITYNNAHEIERCLQSLDWADEIVCVDSLSKDRTQDICRKYGARVIEQPFLGFYRQLQFAENQCKNDWALNIYADETISPELRAELKQVFQKEPEVNGFEISRRAWFHKRFIWTTAEFPGYHLRLFRRSRGGHTPRKVHQSIRVEGKVGRLRHAMDHWRWEADGSLLDNYVEYARLEAQDMCEKNRRVGLAHLLFIPPYVFFRHFIKKRGFLQGSFGAVISMRKACEMTLRLMLAWEMQNREWLDTPDETYRKAQIPARQQAEQQQRASQEASHRG